MENMTGPEVLNKSVRQAIEGMHIPDGPPEVRSAETRDMIKRLRVLLDIAEERLDGDTNEAEDESVGLAHDWSSRVTGFGDCCDPYFPDDPDDYQFDNACQ